MTSSPYTPTDFFKDGRKRTATTWREHWQLIYEGWHASGPAPAAPRVQVPAHLSDIDNAFDPAQNASFAAAVNAAVANSMTSAMAAATVLIPLSSYLAPGQAMPNDGVTDAQPLIQAALDDLLTKANVSHPLGTIRYVLNLPPGRFRLNDSIRPGGAATPATTTRGIGIKGTGANQTFLLTYGAVSGIIVKTPTDATPCATDLYFGDFTIDLANSTHTDPPSGASIKGFIGRGWQDCLFERVTVRNSPHTAFGNDFPIRTVMRACRVVHTGTGYLGTMAAPAGIIESAKNVSGFGIGFGVFDNESILFEGCEATDCYRGGFFFEMFDSGNGFTKRTANIRLNGCSSHHNRIGISNVAGSGVFATNCEITDNTVAGYYGGVSGGTTGYASLNGTLEGCQILRNGYGIYATGDFSSIQNAYTDLRDVLGGYRILNNRIEDNSLGGIMAERFNTIEAGGLVIRGNHIRRNGASGGITLRTCVGPLRDVAIEDNYFDSNTDSGIRLLAAMNAPKINRNTFVNASGSAQVRGIVWHAAEPVSSPQCSGNIFRRINTPLVNAARLNLATIQSNLMLDSTTDPDSPWLYRESFYGQSNIAWPQAGDGWLKNTGGSNSDWNRASTGILKSGAPGAVSYIYRDLGVTGLYVSSRVTPTTDDITLSQFIGVMHSLASSSVRTAVVAGVNGAGSVNTAVSNFYALWKVVGGVWTLLWESTVPFNEGHFIGLSRAAGSTVTNMYIDGELVHTQDISDVPSTSLAGVSSVIITNQKRRLSEFRAMPFA